MIGPTGVGKTEIARRLAMLANAPFIKVEATKFTEVGYVGRDVESIVRDLADAAVKMSREQAVNRTARPRRGRRRNASSMRCSAPGTVDSGPTRNTLRLDSTRQLFRKKLREGELDDREVEIEPAGGNAW